MKLVLLEKLNESGMKSGIFFPAVSVFKIKDRIFCGSYDYELTRAVVSALLFRIPDYWLFVLKLKFFYFTESKRMQGSYLRLSCKYLESWK